MLNVSKMVSERALRGDYKRYYREHREQRLAYSREWLKRNKDKKRIYDARYRERHREEKHKKDREFSKLYYQNHKNEHKKAVEEWLKRHPNFMRDYQRNRYQKRKLELALMLGGKCQRCGYEKNLAALVFHHINPDEKESNQEWRRKSFDISKVILLCRNCHEKSHMKEFGGTPKSARKPNKKKEYKTTEAQRNASKRYRMRHPLAYIYYDRRRRKLKNGVILTQETSCEICGFKDVLDVHHKNRNKKDFSPENLQVICPNCHAEAHFPNLELRE